MADEKEFLLTIHNKDANGVLSFTFSSVVVIEWATGDIDSSDIFPMMGSALTKTLPAVTGTENDEDHLMLLQDATAYGSA